MSQTPPIRHTPPTRRTPTRSPPISTGGGTQRVSPSPNTPPPGQQRPTLRGPAAGFTVATPRASYQQYQIKQTRECFTDDMNLHVDGKQTGQAVGEALFTGGTVVNGRQAGKNANDYVPADKRSLIPSRAWMNAFRQGLQEGFESASHSAEGRRARKVRARLTGGVESAQAGSSKSNTR